MQKVKLILIGQAITAILYALVYLTKSFIYWDLTNPFWWIINLNVLSSTDRCLILFYVAFYYIALYSFMFKKYNNYTKHKS